MQLIHSEGKFLTLSCEPGEDVMEALATYCTDNDIKAAHIAGLGAADKLELAYYNLSTKEYERTLVAEELEILSLNGNVGIKEDGELVVHLHGTFGKRDLSVIGGHIFSLRISGAGELHVRTFDGAINRSYHEPTGLTTMCGLK